MERVRHTEYRADFFTVPHFVNFNFVSIPKSRDGFIGKAHLFCTLKRCDIVFMERNVLFHIDDFFQ